MYVYIWKFQVKDGREKEFESAYGPLGDWVTLFKLDDSYIRTELLVDLQHPGHYLTADYWSSKEAYDSFYHSHEKEFREIDTRSEQFTEKEELIGKYQTSGGRVN